MAKKFTPMVFPQELLTALFLNYFEKLLLGYFFYWNRTRYVTTYTVSEIAEIFCESRNQIIQSVKKMEKYGYIKVQYFEKNNEQYFNLTINIETIITYGTKSQL